MKLSVIIPCFNAADTIAVQLEALANQTWHEQWEIIVCNNGSTDNTVAIVNEYTKKIPHLRLIHALARQGPSYARNMGILAARGEAFAFCDADDEVALGWVAAMGEALNRHELVAGVLDYTKLNTTWRRRNHQQQSGLMYPQHSPYLPFAGGCNLGFKRSLYQAIGGFDESFLYVEDTEYCWRAQLAGAKIHLVPSAIVHYRFRSSLFSNYSQALKWSKAYLPLRQKYGGSLSIFSTLKLYLGGWRYLTFTILQVRSRGDFAEFLWQLGWKIGELQGAISMLSLLQLPNTLYV
ncbi:glycosyltransferase [Gloeocapsopsis crepidinum LEGE 06123]|uniref:Glycosyltransferase n=1 Tax=Gloeocapsopsis crepidinum LEGE 06123 TaxID=588587 RepID=A0ABR9UYG6_9CHRO|nr:glycosyltransferase [Gloeocapsopsis crepidinum]MBE9193365.1 glycosyltransferase [Gloeocapsopsis crepidinum LEGE 06123]